MANLHSHIIRHVLLSATLSTTSTSKTISVRDRVGVLISRKRDTVDIDRIQREKTTCQHGRFMRYSLDEWGRWCKVDWQSTWQCKRSNMLRDDPYIKVRWMVGIDTEWHKKGYKIPITTCRAFICSENNCRVELKLKWFARFVYCQVQ